MRRVLVFQECDNLHHHCRSGVTHRKAYQSLVQEDKDQGKETSRCSAHHHDNGDSRLVIRNRHHTGHPSGIQHHQKHIL